MKIKEACFVTLFAGLLCFASLNAQEVNPLDFFPHHEGDIWEYYEFDQGMVIDTVQNEITRDSLGLDGKYYIQTSLLGDFVLDTLNKEVHVIRNIDALLYKLDVDSGDSWIVQPEFEGFMRARVIDTFSDILFNQPTIVKIISYYSVNTTVNDSLWLGNHYLASGFGLVGEDWDLGGAYRIKGAVIDSIRYGTVTAIEEPAPTQFPQTVVLYQNYPNPFNPVTMIPYQLSRTEKVMLVVYDPLGRKMVTLVNEIQTPGSYSILFDGHQLSGGTYFYQLTIKGVTLSRKMLLVK